MSNKMKVARDKALDEQSFFQNFMSVFSNSDTFLGDVARLAAIVTNYDRDSDSRFKVQDTFEKLYADYEEIPISKIFLNIFMPLAKKEVVYPKPSLYSRQTQIYKISLENFSFVATAWIDEENTFVIQRIKATSLKKFGEEFMSFIQSYTKSKKFEIILENSSRVNYRAVSEATDFIGKYNNNYFATYIQPFKEKNIARTLMFIGHPGTGKTTSAKKIANLGKGSLIICPASILEYGGPFLIELLKPDVFMLENLHTVEKEIETELLAFFENTFEKYPETTIIVTSSDVEELDAGLHRPGRCHDIFYFPLPNKKEIQSLFEFYGKKYNCWEILSPYVENLIKKCVGLSPAYIQDICQSFSVLHDKEFDLNFFLNEKIELAKKLHPKNVHMFQEKELEGCLEIDGGKVVGFW